MSLGIGVYQGAQPSVAQVASDLWLVHLNPHVAEAIRAAHPSAYIVLRPDDGNDGAQVDTSRSPQDEANRWANIIQAKVALVRPGTYNATTGICEAWPGDAAGLSWRAVFEHALCIAVQAGLRLDYAAGSIPAGNLDAANVALFADVFRASRWINVHLYLPPRVKTIEGDTGPWYVWRPLKIWLPELQKLGIPLRLLAGEVGTWTAPNTYADFSLSDELDVARAICAAYTHAGGVEFKGGCVFGVGTVGANADWDLSSVITKLGVTTVTDTTTTPTSPNWADLEAKIQRLEAQNAILTNAWKAFRQGKFTGADGIDGLIVAMQGGAPLGFTPTYPPLK